MIRTSGDMITIEAKHEEVQDGKSHVSRQFMKSCNLPPGVSAETVASSLSKQGMLTITAPKPVSSKTKNHRVIETDLVLEMITSGLFTVIKLLDPSWGFCLI